MKQIPNLFTLLNLFLGCLAIVYSLQLDVSFFYEINGEPIRQSMQASLWMGGLFIGLAAVVDFLDGFVARLLKASSALGKQLDSLSDVVSFGVAPGIILYQVLRFSIMREEDPFEYSAIWLYPAFLVPCFAAYRLAKFNLDDSQQYAFRGVPTPAIALVIASLPFILYYNYFDGSINEVLLNKWVVYALIFILCYLMVSNLRFMSLKFADLSFKSLLPKIILVVVSLVLIFLLNWLAVPVIFILYIILSLATVRPQQKI